MTYNVWWDVKRNLTLLIDITALKQTKTGIETFGSNFEDKTAMAVAHTQNIQ